MEKKGRREEKRSGGRSRTSRRREGNNRALLHFQRTLVDTVKELYRESSGGHEKAEREILIRIHAVIRPDSDWKIEASPSVGRQVENAVREATAKEKVFRPGHVYCYRCDSSHCEHSGPPAPERVFGGYSQTGVPQWPELAQILIEQRHAGVEGIYRQTGRSLAAAFIDAESLKHRQLGIFGKGSKTYDILGQVVFGFLRFPPPKGEAREGDRTAFTLQAVEVRDRSGRPRVVLNVIGKLSDGSEAMEALMGPHHLRVLDVIVTARRLTGKLRPALVVGARTAYGDERKLVASASSILRKTTRSLDRLGRQSQRRTLHAEKRRVEKRPTSKALEDAAGAQDESLYQDDREGTIIVLGSRSRTHVFSPEGRHITSLNLKKEEVESRKRRQRWRPLDAEGRRLFRKSLRSILGE